MHADINGKYLHKIQLDTNSKTAALLIFLDININAKVDTGDLGYANFAITVPEKDDNNLAQIKFDLSLASFSALNQKSIAITGLTFSKPFICIFYPKDLAKWSYNIPANYYAENVQLPLSDWVPIIEGDSNGTGNLTASDVFLPTGEYKSSCIEDTSKDGKYNDSELILNANGGATFSFP